MDFRNFEYVVEENSPPVKVVNGSYVREGDDKIDFTVTNVVFGDISGDGVEEAVVTTSLNTGGSGQFTESLVYQWKRTQPVLVASTGIGDRASGGVFRTSIRGGRLIETRYGPEGAGACCPVEVTVTPLRLQGSKLVRAGASVRRDFLRFDDLVPPSGVGQPEVRFRPGRSSAFIEVSIPTNAVPFFKARRGQTVTVGEVSENVTVEISRNGRVLASVRGAGTRTIKLPVTDSYDFALIPDIDSDVRYVVFMLEIR